VKDIAMAFPSAGCQVDDAGDGSTTTKIKINIKWLWLNFIIKRLKLTLYQL
jgi:hypothetical protein